jgi:hypothetical protein
MKLIIFLPAASLRTAGEEESIEGDKQIVDG